LFSPAIVASRVTAFVASSIRDRRRSRWLNHVAAARAVDDVVERGAEPGRRQTVAGRDDDLVRVGLGGADTISWLGGDDVICGGDAPDDVDGGAGNDWIDGGPCNDGLRGGNGTDTCLSGEARMSSCEL
jgi:Ca2+-binding RTX toxin-like protein